MVTLGIYGVNFNCLSFHCFAMRRLAIYWDKLEEIKAEKRVGQVGIEFQVDTNNYKSPLQTLHVCLSELCLFLGSLVRPVNSGDTRGQHWHNSGDTRGQRWHNSCDTWGQRWHNSGDTWGQRWPRDLLILSHQSTQCVLGPVMNIQLSLNYEF